MFDDEAPACRRTVHEIGQDLSALSIEEIELRIAQLREEIERLAEARARKVGVQAAAQALFKS